MATLTQEMKGITLLIFLALLYSVMAEEKKEEQQPSQPLPIFGNPIGLVADGVASEPKRHWPELMGLTAEEAETKVKLDMPAAQVQVVPPDHFVTMDFNTRRVRLYLDAAGKIARTPQVG